MMRRKIANISNFFRKLRSQKGYVAILLAAFIPVILFGTKLILDFMTLHESEINLHGAGTIYRNCANEAALEVAKNWNPGIGLSYQKRALLKVADRVYNNTVGVDNSTTLSKAVPGIQMMEQKSCKLGRGFDPVIIKTGLATPGNEAKGISYTTKSMIKRNVICSFNNSNQWNWPFTTWMILDKLTSQNSENFVYDKFDEVIELVQEDDVETSSEGDTIMTQSELETTAENNQTDESTEKYILNHIDRYTCMHPEKIRHNGRYQDTDGGKILCTVVVDKETLDVTESGFTSEFKDSIGNDKSITPGPEMNIDDKDVSTTQEKNESNNGEASYMPAVNSADTATIPGTEGEANENNSSEESVTDGNEENSENNEYTYRTNEDDQRVQLTVENDKIAVQIDKRTKGYAVPAECNVDIILACPTNSAANEILNSDGVSAIKDEPTDDDIKRSQIYQIGQAFRTFAKQFYHIRGVTMGLIPYSGKISISPESSLKGWACVGKNFAEEDYLNQGSTFQPFLTSSVLYNSNGVKDDDLKDCNFTWGTLLTGYPIRSRRDVLSTDTPISDNFTQNGSVTGGTSSQQDWNISQNEQTSGESNLNKFFRQNSNPCYGGYASLLSMKCTKNCPEYLPNPYYIIEPTADIRKIYEMCGALYPFYDEHNSSNFIFAAVTWANNLWQSWTNDPECDSADTALDTNEETPDGGHLSVPSKMDIERAKALILVVNEPDHFESEELTYLGFNNDFSEIPMAESDYIAFPDNDNNVAISGANGVIKFSGNCNGGKLEFPKKHLVRVIAKPQITWVMNKSSYGSVYKKENSTKNTLYKGIVDEEQNTFLSVNNTNKLVYSTDCENWHDVATTETFDTKHTPVYSNGTWCILCQDEIKYSIDGAKTWEEVGGGISFLYIAAGNGKFMGIAGDGTVYISTDAKIWEKVNENAPIPSDVIYLCYGNGRWFCMTNKSVLESTDDGQNWKIIYTHDFSDTCSACYSNGYLYFVTKNGDINKIYNGIATNMKSTEATTISSNLTFHNGKFYSLTDSSVITGELSGNIKFTNLKTNLDETNNEMTKGEGISITDQREFFIEPQQIDENCIDISLTNAQGVAEITNRPYSIKKKDNDTYPYWNEGQIRTNIKCPISVSIKPSETIQKSITFSEVSENVGEKNVEKPTLFEFKGSTITDSDGNISFNENENFKDKFEYQKISYSLNNVKIIDVTLKNQLIRINGNKKDSCIVEENNSFNNEAGYYEGGKWIIYGVQAGATLYKLSKIIQTNTENSGTGNENQTAEGDQDNQNDQEVSSSDSNSNSKKPTWKKLNESEFTIDSGGVCTVEITDSNEAIYQICVANGGEKKLLNTGELGDNIEKNKGIVLLEKHTSENTTSGDHTSKNYICFSGDGTLLVTVVPILDGKILYNTPENKEKTMIISEPQTLIIDPSNYRYSKENDEYIINFKTSETVTVDKDKIEFVDGNDVGVYEEIRLPKRSEVSASKMIELSNVTNEVNTVSDPLDTSSLSYTGLGDFYILLDDVDMITQKLKLSLPKDGGELKELTFSGLYREFIPCTNKNSQIEIEFIGNITQPINRIQLVTSGFTLPVNEILYNRNNNAATGSEIVYTQITAADDSANVEESQSTNGVDYTNPESVQRSIEAVTTAACKKLRENFKDNLLIYLIKYRQAKNGSSGTNSLSNTQDTDDLDYLDDCADKIYNVTHNVSNKDQSESLETTLLEIAEDIKKSANYQKARNVSP